MLQALGRPVSRLTATVGLSISCCRIPLRSPHVVGGMWQS